MRSAVYLGMVVALLGVGCRAEPPTQVAYQSAPEPAAPEPTAEEPVDQPTVPPLKAGPPLSISKLALRHDAACIIDDAGAVW